MGKVDFTEKELVDNAKELYNSIEEYCWKLIQALKELIEMAKKSMEDMNKRNDDLFDDIIKTLPKDAVRDKGLVGIVPCKSDAE